MTSFCPACGYETSAASCPRCGFAAPGASGTPVALAKAESAPPQPDPALFDATVAPPTTFAYPVAPPPVGAWPAAGPPAAAPPSYGGWPDQPAAAPPGIGGPADWQGQPPPMWTGPGTGRRPPSSSSVGATVAAHLVLWLGLLAVSVSYGWLANHVFEAVGTTAAGAVLGLLDVLPVAVATLIAGRGATLRVVALVGGLAVLGASVFATMRASDFDTWPVRMALCVLALAVWITVRRHARIGYVVLVPAALVLLLWFPSFGPAPSIAYFPESHGITSLVLLNLWYYLPIVVMAGFGLLSSLLKPIPPRERDALGWAVVGPLILVVVLLMPVLSAVHDSPVYAGSASSVVAGDGSARR